MEARMQRLQARMAAVKANVFEGGERVPLST